MIVALIAGLLAATSPLAEVADTLDALMASINTNDADAFLALQQPGTFIQIQRFKPDGTSALEVFPATDFAAKMRARKGTAVDERLIEPQFFITRDFAHVWAPYSLDIAGKRKHCGVDSFGFIKTGGTWRLTSLAWTIDPTGCPK